MERVGAADTGADAERKGLGTPATRADVIEKLVHDGFVRRKKKQLVPTGDGIKLIRALHLQVLQEEEHMKKMFREDYIHYMEHTFRYFGKR